MFVSLASLIYGVCFSLLIHSNSACIAAVAFDGTTSTASKVLAKAVR